MAKRQNKTKSASCTITGQAERVGIFGASGCGKTTKARELTRKLSRIIFFEPLADDIRRLQGEGFKAIIGLDNIKKAVQSNFSRGFRLAYYPAVGSEPQELSDLSNWLMSLQHGYGFTHAAQITLAVDELDLSFPTGTSLKDPRNGFKNLCCRGRHTGINLVCMSQRMHLIDNVFRANCSAVYLFRHSEPADIDVGVKIIGREYRENLRNLANFQYIYKAGEKIFVHS